MKGDMNSLSISDNCFDWVWSADCVGYAPGNAARLIKYLAGVVNPAVMCLFSHGHLNSCCRDTRG